MTKYNLEKLVKIECNDFYPARFYSYKKEKKFFGFVTQKEGFYSNTLYNYLGLEAPKNYTLKNGVLYENPQVILYYQSDYSKTYYFNSFDEAKKFSDEITKKGRWQS